MPKFVSYADRAAELQMRIERARADLVQFPAGTGERLMRVRRNAQRRLRRALRALAEM